MKKITIISFLLFSVILFSQTTYVPDDNFEQALIDLGYDDVLDDYVLTANINNVTSLHIPSKNISDLTGIEGFSALQYLKCWGNHLITLDLSFNPNLVELRCSGNDLTNINIQYNPYLQILNCENNELTGINLSNNNQLIELKIRWNNFLYLDVTSNIVLEKIWCSFNEIVSIDLRNNTSLQDLDCHYNQLEELDVRNGTNPLCSNFHADYNPDLRCILVDDPNWSEENWIYIDQTANYVEDQTQCEDLLTRVTYVPDDSFEQALIDFGLDSGPLDDYVLTVNIHHIGLLSLNNRNISDLTGIEDFKWLWLLDCYDNQLVSLDLNKNSRMLVLDCHSNNLESLNISNSPVLEILKCYDNQLSALDIENNIQLTRLQCQENQITNIDLHNNTLLYSFKCYSNLLTGLDVSNNLGIRELDCSSNHITELDLTVNPLLDTLISFNNQLTQLDISNNEYLYYLDCSYNQLNSLDVRNGNNENISNFYASYNPDLTCIFVDDAEWSAENWTNIDPVSTFVETQEQCDAIIGIDEVIVSENLQIYPNPTQSKLSIKTTDLTDKNYTIYDIYGSISIQGVLNDEEIDISALKAGIYLLKLGDTITKIMKL